MAAGTALGLFLLTSLLNLDDVELSGPLPRFLPNPNFYSVAAGDTATLQCAVTQLDDKKVIWRRASDGIPLTVGEDHFRDGNGRIRSQHKPHSDEWNLVILNVSLHDSGVYECQVSSKLRYLRFHVLLEVHERERTSTPAAKPSIFISGANAVDKDARIQLVCNATGKEYPPGDLDWFIEGNKLQTTTADEKVSIRKFVSLTDKTIVSILEIKDAQLEDSGLYTCRTSNLQVISMHVAVLNADTHNVKRGTYRGFTGGSANLLPSLGPLVGLPRWLSGVLLAVVVHWLGGCFRLQ